MPWISWWKETPLVIGVKENMPPVCHEVLCGTHSTSLISHTLTEPFPQPPIFPLLRTLCTHALMPSFPFLT